MKSQDKIISFKNLIDNLLRINKNEIHSIHGLERFIGSGVGSVKKYYDQDRFPGLGTIKKIKNSFGLSDAWIETGKGDVFEEKSTEDIKNATAEEPEMIYQKYIKLLEEKVEKLQSDNANLKRQLEGNGASQPTS